MMLLLYSLLGVMVLILLLLIIWLCSMHRNMPWQNCLAIMRNLKIPLPKFLKEYALSGERDYSTLPDPLVMTEGSAVSTPEQFEARRDEILELFTACLRQAAYGRIHHLL